MCVFFLFARTNSLQILKHTAATRQHRYLTVQTVYFYFIYLNTYHDAILGGHGGD